MKIWRLGSCENFVGKWEELVFDAVSYSEPVESNEHVGWEWYDRSFNNSTSKSVLDLLEMG